MLGYAQVGVLTERTREGVGVDAITGTSAGAVVTALHAFGVPLGVIPKRLADLSWREITGPRRPAGTGG